MLVFGSGGSSSGGSPRPARSCRSRTSAIALVLVLRVTIEVMNQIRNQSCSPRTIRKKNSIQIGTMFAIPMQVVHLSYVIATVHGCH